MNKNLRFTLLLIAAILVGFHLTIPAAHAQTEEPLPPGELTRTFCPGNLVANGDFTAGLPPWTAAYGTPDPSTGPGCHDPGVVGMWGNMNPAIGEGLQQILANPLMQGKTYIVSLCVKNGTDSTKLPYARFRVRATATPQAFWGLPGTIGLTGHVSGPAWTPVDFIWTATSGPLPYLTINVENDSNVNDGAQTSYGLIDDVCIRELDFTATTVCQGQATSFSSNATAATSWSWSFGDNSPSSNLQSPTHTYASAGTYNVKLCVNATTSCVTKPVTVNPIPPVPVISGPANLCSGLTASYSVPTVNGVTYSWSVTNGTINGSSTGHTVNVTWNASGGGQISVVATNAQKCSSSASMKVPDCKVWLDSCCIDTKITVTTPNPQPVGNDVYALTPTLTTPGTVVRVVADVISTERTFFSATCGLNGPVSSEIVNASPVSTFNPSFPVSPSREVIWHTTPVVNLSSGLTFPFQVHFPPMLSSSCSETLNFCVKYTITSATCRSCEVIRCYSILRKGQPIPTDLPN
ncbi:MAG TPA: PKD domain-containing protein [Thermoanaerobaculia bacterium]|jgi:PKD repeat protein|nr:PKD domain-containing protein [Thermoanaerobaculia bacterium]